MFILIRAQLLAGLARYGLETVRVVAGQQPTAQGRDSGTVLYFFEAADHRYGWQHRSHVWNPVEGRIDTEERQWHETTLQMSCLGANPDACDVIEVAAMVCNSEKFVTAVRSGKVGVQRVTGIRTPYFRNDQDQNEPSPSFDLIVSWRRDLSETTPAIERAEFDMGRI